MKLGILLQFPFVLIIYPMCVQLLCSKVTWVNTLACVFNHLANLVYDAASSYLQVLQLFLTLHSNTQHTYTFRRMFKLVTHLSCVYGCFTCLYVCLCSTCLQCPWRPEEGVRYPGTGARDSNEPPCEFCDQRCVLWKGPITDEQFLQPLNWICNCSMI